MDSVEARTQRDAILMEIVRTLILARIASVTRRRAVNGIGNVIRMRSVTTRDAVIESSALMIKTVMTARSIVGMEDAETSSVIDATARKIARTIKTVGTPSVLIRRAVTKTLNVTKMSSARIKSVSQDLSARMIRIVMTRRERSAYMEDAETRTATTATARKIAREITRIARDSNVWTNPDARTTGNATRTSSVTKMDSVSLERIAKMIRIVTLKMSASKANADQRIERIDATVTMTALMISIASTPNVTPRKTATLIRIVTKTAIAPKIRNVRSSLTANSIRIAVTRNTVGMDIADLRETSLIVREIMIVDMERAASMASVKTQRNVTRTLIVETKRNVSRTSAVIMTRDAIRMMIASLAKFA